MVMANQEFQQSAARADAWVEAKGYQNGSRMAVNEVYNELIRIENGQGTQQQKAEREADYLKVVLDQNKALKAHGFPEIEISENNQHLTIKATGASGDSSSVRDRTAFSYGKENPGTKELTAENVLFHHLRAEDVGTPAEKAPTYPAPQYVGKDGMPTGTELPPNKGGDNIQTGNVSDNGNPELRARANLRHLRNGAIDISTDNFPQGPAYEGSTERMVHFKTNPQEATLSASAPVNFEIKLPYGVKPGDRVEGMVHSNATGKNDDHVKGQVVMLPNNQLAFQGDEDVSIRDGNNFYPAHSYDGTRFDPSQLLIPLTLK
jgi:hypothetical protein